MRRVTPIVTAVLMLVACKTVYVPVKTVEKVTVRDTTYLRWTDTLVRVEKARISEFSGLLDTLYLEVPLARSTAFVDTATATLRGTLEQSGSVPVKIVEREHIVYRDSVRDREVPVPVEVVKRERYVPWFYRLFAVIGIAALAVVVFWILRRFKVL
jgi:hypothetical protein